MRRRPVSSGDEGTVDHPPGWGTGQNIVVLRWPEEQAKAARLASAGLPRLLLVEPGASPPEGGDCEEDWLRLPADDRDVSARLRALARRAGRHVTLPQADGHGRLLHRGRWVSLSPINQRIAGLLVERFGQVVHIDEVARRAWDEPPTSNAVRVHLSRLRHRIAPVGLDIRCMRGVGMLLEERRGQSCPFGP
jgi:two-component system, OmpR family, response regulator